MDRSDACAALMLSLLVPFLVLTDVRRGIGAALVLEAFFVVVLSGVLVARVRRNRRRMTEGE